MEEPQQKERLLIAVIVVTVFMPVAYHLVSLVPPVSEVLSETTRQIIAGICLIFLGSFVFVLLVGQFYEFLEAVEQVWKKMRNKIETRETNG